MSSKPQYADQIKSLSPDPEIGSFTDLLIDSLRTLPEDDRQEILRNHVRMMEVISEIDASMSKIILQAAQAAQLLADKPEEGNRSLESPAKESENNG